MGEPDLILDPIPSILIESMRDIGYSFNTALADIVDNSIAASATKINIVADTENEPVLAVIDNGKGLTKDELLESLRMGSNDPRQKRAKTDLGRFGLGLKTASFSQCRKLTVASKKNGFLTAFTWDLDHVVKTNKWELLRLANPEEIPFVDLIGAKGGTLVLWENMDRVVGDLKSKEETEKVFLRTISEAERHIALVFHRFLEREPGFKKISMTLNERPIEPLDPFNSKHEATIVHPKEPVMKGVTVQAFTLPHSSKYPDSREYEKYGLVGGYQKNQGVYLYRARRLIIHGTWFNLAKKTALTQLCRVKIDIDNTQDETWKIDVKKVSAQPPEEVRGYIRDFINTFSGPSKKVYRRRGAKQTSESLHPVWTVIRDNNHVSYKINRDHPILEKAALDMGEEGSAQLEQLLRLIEAGFPTDAIFCEISNNPESVTAAKLKDEELQCVAKEFFGMLKSQGKNDDEIISIMNSVDMFQDDWESVTKALGIAEG